MWDIPSVSWSISVRDVQNTSLESLGRQPPYIWGVLQLLLWLPSPSVKVVLSAYSESVPFTRG